jgi:H+/Cl- antiporter ClcA
METLKIAFTCVVAAVLYGIVHDQFTARICLEYFTVFHPPIFHTQSPTLLGIGWGIIATWWVGAFLSVPMIVAARAGRRPPLPASEILRPIAFLLAVMAVIAVLSGITGYVLARRGVLETEWLSGVFPLKTMRYRFIADWWAHTASYGTAFVGGIVVCVATYRKRGLLNVIVDE